MNYKKLTTDKKSAKDTLQRIYLMVERTGGNGFRKFTIKKNGGSKKRNNNTLIDKMSNLVDG